MKTRDERKWWFVVSAVVLSFAVSFGSQLASAQQITLDNSKTGVYKALAQLVLESFKKGDMQTAAVLGRILDRTWDQIEENGEHGLNKTNSKLFEDVDEAMDAFIKPIIHYQQKAPDPASVEAAYRTYVEKLKSAD